MTTRVSAPTEPSALVRLERALQKRIHLAIADIRERPSSAVGHQYLFFVIPFGEIKIHDVSDWSLQAFRESAALRGGQVVLSPTARNLVELSDLSVNALDLFFFRVIRCTLTFRVFIGEQWSENESVSVTEPVLFARELELQDAVEQLLSKLAEHPLLLTVFGLPS